MSPLFYHNIDVVYCIAVYKTVVVGKIHEDYTCKSVKLQYCNFQEIQCLILENKDKNTWMVE